MIGPVQVLVVGLDRPSFSGEVLTELTRLRQAGIVRLVDLILVSRAEDGGFEAMPVPSDGGDGLGRLAAQFLGRPESTATSTAQDGADADISGDTAWSLADAVPPGSTAAVALIEHVWAGPLSAAIKRTGGVPLEESWLAPADLEALEALEASITDTDG